jgi:hypothetical protein
MNKRRRGSMLIEQVALMGVSSSIFLIALGLLHQTLKYKRTSQMRTESVLATGRLSQQIRTDGLQCIEAKISSEETMELVLANTTTVRFRSSKNVVTREKIEGMSNAMQVVARESYFLGSNCNATFEVQDGQFACIRFIEVPANSSETVTAASPTRVWTIVAPLGPPGLRGDRGDTL